MSHYHDLNSFSVKMNIVIQKLSFTLIIVPGWDDCKYYNSGYWGIKVVILKGPMLRLFLLLDMAP